MFERLFDWFSEPVTYTRFDDFFSGFFPIAVAIFIHLFF